MEDNNVKKKRKKKKMSIGKRIALIVVISVFVVGAGIFLFPFINDWYHKGLNSKAIAEFSEKAESNTLTTDYAGLRKALEEYNKSLVEKGQGKIVDVDGYEIFPVDISKYGLPNDMIGYISIPAIGENLPIYLGADYNHMANGTAVLGQTSAPIGGNNTNTVIAGHRGFYGATMFKYIGKLNPGDHIYITNPWEKLDYKVIERIIINPNEFDKVLIQKDKDMITLQTCEPYGATGKYRMLVYAERVKG